ncbi:hypothetical protein [Lactobacillus helveticus]|uniref:Uncharacterized protein n=1 Tax=Lactobacillus helveticus TaxID=1587 RepID=A0A6A7K2A4_LACHE|nr:hypothetical protein [Lactobacillus helveticus]MPW14709.1 hypothetical protein [Lactobacillus helveticus]
MDWILYMKKILLTSHVLYVQPHLWIKAILFLLLITTMIIALHCVYCVEFEKTFTTKKQKLYANIEINLLTVTIIPMILVLMDNSETVKFNQTHDNLLWSGALLILLFELIAFSITQKIDIKSTKLRIRSPHYLHIRYLIETVIIIIIFALTVWFIWKNIIIKSVIFK